MMRTERRVAGTLILTVSALGAAHAAEDADSGQPAASTAAGLPAVTITGNAAAQSVTDLPATTATVTQEQMQASVNAVDVEDAAKYLPSIFIRKRNYGDTQPVLATRTWGVNSSARTLVFVDDIPISALIANNNTIGAPRWGMVSPEQIDHIDMLYGPFSAEYSGNSMGGVMHIVTRSPEKTEFTFKQTEALQSFDLYDTDNHDLTSETSATAGGRLGTVSWFLAGNFQNSFSQPLTFVTAGAAPAGTTGTIAALNKVGQTADVLGAGGLLHTEMSNVTAHVSDDVTSTLRATYLVGYWYNNADSHISTYLRDTAGQPTFGRAAGFASNYYTLIESHLMQAIALKSDSHEAWDGEAVVTYYDFLRDRQLSPAGVTMGANFSPNGRLADLGGTSWGTVDLKGIWRPFGFDGSQQVAFGVHADRYTLNNPTLNTTAWSDADTQTTLYSSGRGKTITEAVWVEDVWKFSDALTATLGGRYEHWKAVQGYNFSGTQGVVQPEETDSAFSPKLTVGWHVDADWTMTGSVAKAVRFPTVGELYQLVSTGSTFSSPNPDLKPERDISGEVTVERSLPGGSVRTSFFQENTRNALVSQTAGLAAYPVPVTYVVNVGEIRNRGVELAWQKADLLFQGFELAGSVTFVDSTILSNGRFLSSTGTTSDGKHAPYVPRWRSTLVATYRPIPSWALTVAGRYSGQMYSTVDNSDTTSNVFGGFDSFLVIDARAHYEVTSNLSASVGVDNLNDRKYFLYHPFPQRTVVADIRVKF